MNRILLFLLGAAICYVTLAIQGGGRNWTIATILTGLYMLKLAPIFFRSIRTIWRKYKTYVISPLVFWVLLTFMNAFYSDPMNNIPIINSTVFMCYLLYLFFIVHFENDKDAYKYALNGFVVGNIIMSVLFLLGIGVEFDVESERLSMFGSNENQLGIYMDIATIIIISMWIMDDAFHLKKWRYLLFLLLFPMLSLIVATASRTALLIVVIALLISILTRKSSSIFYKFLFVVVGCVALIYGYHVLIPEDSVMAERMELTVEDGNTSGRTDIVEQLIPYAWEHPFFGVGQTGYVEIAILALSKVSVIGGVTYGYSPHNVLVEILLYTGLFGLFAMLIFWTGVFKCAYSFYKRNDSALFILLLIPIAACIFSGQILGDKFAWLIYAVIIFGSNNLKNNKISNY